MEYMPVKVEVFHEESVICDGLHNHPQISVKMELDAQDDKGDIPGSVGDVTTKKETGFSNDVVKRSEPSEQDSHEAEKSDFETFNMETDKPYPLILYKVDTEGRSDRGSNNESVKADDEFVRRSLKIVDDHPGNQSSQCTFSPSNSSSENSEMWLGRSEATEKSFIVSLCSDLHQPTDTGVKPYKCPLCPCSYSRKFGLKKHQVTHTCEKPKKCSLCPYRCVCQGDLRKHQRTHTGEKPYKRSLCPYSCIQKGNLNTHQLTHTGEKPYKCLLCPYSCAVKTNLKTHQLTHTGVKPYKCSLCPYSCTVKTNLNTHQLTHTGVKPYKCSLCPYRCTQKGNLRTHLLTHCGEKPYKCSLCPFSCTRKGHLQIHQLTHYNEKPHK